MEQNTTTGSHISVIIPVYNEMETINAAIQHLRTVTYGHPIEIIVSDGGPDHQTLSALDAEGVITVESPAGRGVQMNTGAAEAQGDILLFLHADTRLPADPLTPLLQAIKNGARAGAFSLSIDSPKRTFAILAWFANLRSRMEAIPYGDQAQFIRTKTFRKLGGFAEIPIMEDVELFRRIRDKNLPIAILPEKVKTSPRRWEKEGTLRRTLTNWWLRIRYALGASPESLATHYRPNDNTTKKP